MTFASVCSGIEAASVAWQPLGWRCAFVSEIEPFCCALLKHYHPEVPNYGDILRFSEWPAATIDVLAGGTPCQSFSVAGLRGGLADPRGNLTLCYLAVLARYLPRWCVWENVPGILSDRGGAFGQFLDGLTQCGYGWAWRVLDAQYFGLAQRRERVFVVGCSGGDWRRAAAVLFDGASLRGNPAPRREAWKRIAPSLANRARGGGGFGTDAECDGALVATITKNYATMHGRTAGNNGSVAENQLVAHTYTSEGHDASEDGTGRGVPLVSQCVKLRTERYDAETQDFIPVAFTCKDNGRDARSDLAPTSRSMNHAGSHANGSGQLAVSHGMAVRRLTPREVERLFGFHDDYTLIPYRGKPACDGPRYRALGNSFAVPVVRWIGERIEKLHKSHA